MISILFLLWIVLVITCGVVQIMYSFGPIRVAAAVIIICLSFIGLCISFGRYKGLQDVEDSRFFVNLIDVLNRFNVTKDDYERLILESENIIYQCSKKFDKSLSFIYKLSSVMLLAPVGFLLSLRFTLEGNAITSNLEEYINNILKLVPMIIVLGIVVIVTLIMLSVFIRSDIFMNWVFYDRKVATIMKRYLGTLCYEKTVIHDTLLTRDKKLC